MILCKDRAGFAARMSAFDGMNQRDPNRKTGINRREEGAMRLLIEIAAATLIVCCISVTSAALAAAKTCRSADGLNCAYSAPKDATPKFYANYCGDKMLSAM